MTTTEKRLSQFRVQYFKPSGKFYTDAVFDYECRYTGETAYMPDAVAKIRGLRDCGGPEALPGLCGDGWSGFIHIDCDDGYPCLLTPYKENE